MMMSILWYYRPEHTDSGRRPDDLPDEIFASKHRDHLSVACIEDRCYVLTFNEYCRLVHFLTLIISSESFQILFMILVIYKLSLSLLISGIKTL